MCSIDERIRLEKKKRDNEEIKAYLISMAVASISSIIGVMVVFEDLKAAIFVSIVIPFPAVFFYWFFGGLGLVQSKNPAWWHLTAGLLGVGFIGFILNSMFSLS